MILIAPIFFILSCPYFLKSSDILDGIEYGGLQEWDVPRSKRDKPREDATEEFIMTYPKPMKVTCDSFYETYDTPFVTSVLFKTSGRLICMGMIVDESHIVTAKKCYDKVEPNEILVLAGTFKAYWGKWSQVKKVKKIIRHETDVAILKLKGRFRFRDNVQAGRLPSATLAHYGFKELHWQPPYKVIGFPVDRYSVPGDPVPIDLKYVMKEDNDVGEADCKKNFAWVPWKDNFYFCLYGNSTFCWGALGSPILKSMLNPGKKEPFWLVIGFSVNDNCSATTTGPVFGVRSDKYVNWINENSFHDHEPQ